MIRFVKKATFAVLYILSIIWTAMNLVADWIGRSTLGDDAVVAEDLGRQGLNWLFSTPWWGPLVLFGLLTAVLFWWMRQPESLPAGVSMASGDDKQAPLQARGDRYTNTGQNFGHMGPVNNYGPTRLAFDPALADKIIAKIGKQIRHVTVVGGAADQAIASQYLAYFEARGVVIGEVTRAGILSPPRSHWFEGEASALVITPSAG